MKAMRFLPVARFARHERGNFTLAATLVAVPIIMGLALAVDFSRIDRATRSASFSLFTAVRTALSPTATLTRTVPLRFMRPVSTCPTARRRPSRHSGNCRTAHGPPR